ENTPPKETKSQIRSLDASPESLAALHRFLTYIYKPKPVLTKDNSAQVELLTRHVRDGIEHLWQEYAKFEKDNPGYDCSPDNDLWVLGIIPQPTRLLDRAGTPLGRSLMLSTAGDQRPTIQGTNDSSHTFLSL